eukprot:TRINITY_DN8889_c0_g1_i3.p1 TRINITY_DN8889_c0_g1~~TRINITY_DN8889_c0_g1_i3.p1  ORF type:complete len:423 (-),score=39.51 TRINITY_DN8889_c0_g1_i3:317-1585(-)
MFLFFLLAFTPSLATRLSGSLVTKENWHFLGKFCFSNTRFDGQDPLGTLEWIIESTNTNLSLVFYLGDSDTGSWGPVYSLYKSGNWTCKKLMEMRHVTSQSRGIVEVTSNETGFIQTLDVVRPYWWYVALADCDSEGLSVSRYDLHFLNPAPNGTMKIWYTEFSYDTQGLAQTYILFVIFYLFVGATHLYAVTGLVTKNEYHPLIRLVTIGLVFLFISYSFYIIHFVVFSYSGQGIPVLEAFAMALTMLAQLFLMFFCILVSKGWTITTPYLTQANLLKLFLVLITGCYLGLILWHFILRDPASTVYFYDSPIGLVIVILRMAMATWFCWNIYYIRKIENDSQKRKFYVYFGLVFFLWFILLPMMVGIALGLPPWYREFTISGISLAIDAFGYVCLVFLFWPGRVNNYFSFSMSFLPVDEDL